MENAGYTITERITVGDVTIVLGESPGTPSPYVTWRHDPETGAYYWGHYHSDRLVALADYGRRITEAAERKRT